MAEEPRIAASKIQRAGEETKTEEEEKNSVSETGKDNFGMTECPKWSISKKKLKAHPVLKLSLILFKLELGRPQK